MNPTYLATARLLTEIAPVVFESGIFALKGGTAINLFLRDMPRLSVDLDLVFTDHRLPRAEALAAINELVEQVWSWTKTVGLLQAATSGRRPVGLGGTVTNSASTDTLPECRGDMSLTVEKRSPPRLHADPQPLRSRANRSPKHHVRDPHSTRSFGSWPFLSCLLR